jgi:hypothetical protein
MMGGGDSAVTFLMSGILAPNPLIVKNFGIRSFAD